VEIPEMEIAEIMELTGTALAEIMEIMEIVETMETVETAEMDAMEAVTMVVQDHLDVNALVTLLISMIFVLDLPQPLKLQILNPALNLNFSPISQTLNANQSANATAANVNKHILKSTVLLPRPEPSQLMEPSLLLKQFKHQVALKLAKMLKEEDRLKQLALHKTMTTANQLNASNAAALTLAIAAAATLDATIHAHAKDLPPNEESIENDN
jgi:hypothetical protein